MPDGMTPENSHSQFKIGTNPVWMQEATRNPVDLLGAEEDSNSEMEAMYANYSMDEERSRMDPEFQRMINAESPRDIAPMLESLRREMDTDFSEAQDKYGNTRALSAAWKRSMIFEKGHDYLTSPDQLIVVKRNNRRLPGTINIDGSIGEDSVPRVGGYSLYVDTKMVETPYVIEKSTYDKQDKFSGRIEEKHLKQIRKEEINYGSEETRKLLSKTYLDFVKQGIVVEQVFNHSNLLWNFRAALEGMVKTIYTKEIYKSNAQIDWFFNAPDLNEIVKNPENKKVGEQRDKATRLLELVGYCETKEKLEKHLNSTFNLESILDLKTQNRVLGLMKELGEIDSETMQKLVKEENDPSKVSERFKAVVKFLIGEKIEIAKIKITKEERSVMQYKLGDGWLTAEQRDPSKTTDKEEKKKRGKNAIKEEKGVRGWLTLLGNPYVGHTLQDRDNMTSLLAKFSLIVGDNTATTEAHKNFYWWGEPDWLGAEIYAPDAIPDGATLANKRSELRGQAWLDYAKEIASYFTTGGEPVGTDLIKIMWPDLYRLKDMVAGQGRPTGQYVTVGGMDHLAQSFFGLVRSEITVNGKEKMRNIREQWLGSKDETLGIEQPHNLGEIEWAKVNGSTEITSELISERVGNIDWKDVEITDSQRKIIDNYKKGDKTDLINKINSSVTARTEPIITGAEGLYWLMNFLVADENEVKRMWAALNTDLKPDTLTLTSGFTGKIKFMDITQVVQGSYDGYIAVEKRAIANKNYDKKGQPDIEDQVSNESKARAKSYLRTWYKGVKGDPQYRTWFKKPIDLGSEFGGEDVKTTMGEYVDNLAEMYGFIDKENINERLDKLPRLIVKK